MLNVKKNRIEVKLPTFNAKDTLRSGQCFRFFEEEKVTKVFAKDQYAEIYEENGITVIECTSEKFFVNYFDLEKNYDIIVNDLRNARELKAAVEYGKGIRLLNQYLPEVLVGFIISANNNIPRIKNAMKSICGEFGRQENFGRTFPELSVLSKADEKFFVKAGLGYRAPFMVNTLRAINNTGFLDNLIKLPTPDAKKGLMTLSGVGSKVADCVLLFGLGRKDVFPVDTWIEKVYYTQFSKETRNRAQIADYFTARFKELSGYAQQYLFYYKRENK